MALFHSFFMAENIPWIYMYFFTTQRRVPKHFFIIHSSVDAPLGCFHVLADVNSAAVNIGVHVAFQIIIIFFFLYIYPGMDLPGNIVLHSGCFTLHFHQQCWRVTFFSISSSELIICRLFGDSHSNWSDVILLYCGFDFYFSNE